MRLMLCSNFIIPTQQMQKQLGSIRVHCNLGIPIADVQLYFAIPHTELEIHRVRFSDLPLGVAEQPTVCWEISVGHGLGLGEISPRASVDAVQLQDPGSTRSMVTFFIIDVLYSKK